MTTILATIFFFLGLAIGSFLNVVIYRLNTQKTFGGRSACMTCREQLCWYELIPLISYLGLHGRCRSCNTKISIQYPVVEFITGVLFMMLFLHLEEIFYFNTLVFAVSYAYYAGLFALLIIIAVYDYKHKIIPDTLSLVFGVLTFVGMFLFLGNVLTPHIPSLYDFLAGLIVSIPFALMWLVSGGHWMGLGDAKLAVGLGFMLGFNYILSATALAVWTGAIVGIFAMFLAKKKYSRKSELPFAPFLIFGTILVFFLNICLFNLNG